MSDWYSVTTPEETERLLGAWEDAPTENVELCGFLVNTARLQVLSYAPESDTLSAALELVLVRFDLVEQLADLLELLDVDPGTPPFNYVYAQLQQAKNLWNAGRVTSGGEVGVDQFSYTPRPLDKTIRNIIRPEDGKPHVL